jgi:hypothetical protein
MVVRPKRHENKETPARLKRLRDSFIWPIVGALAAPIFLGFWLFGIPVNAPSPPEQILEKIEPGSEAPQGYSSVSVPSAKAKLVVPTTWQRWEDQYFRDAKAATANLMGVGAAPGEPVYSAAALGNSGNPIAIIQILLEPGPAPTQEQTRKFLESGSEGFLELPAKSAELIGNQSVPVNRPGFAGGSFS